MTDEKSDGVLRDRLGKLPPECFSNDYDPDRTPMVKTEGLDERERRLVARVMRHHPELTEAEAIEHLREAGL